MSKKIKAFLIFMLSGQVLLAQDVRPAFYSDIMRFKKQDSLHFPSKQAILFVGSSSFTKWTDIQDYFPGYPVLNRGFGGSTLPDLIRYANDIIIPYQPKQVIIYCGDNDLASSDTVTAETVSRRFQHLFGLIRKGLPGVPIAFVSIKPSPSRWHLKQKAEEANRLIQNFLSKENRAKFIDVYDKMLGNDGRPLGSIFIEDSLHMNAKGYAIWQKVINPYLVK